jgi:mercuric ion transport protein
METASSGGALRWGIVGTVIAALCCFTPVLAILLGTVGFSWAVGYLDYVLLPALAFFVGLTVYAVWKQQKNVRAGVACDDKTSANSQQSKEV